jgi:hypothetical protein
VESTTKLLLEEFKELTRMVREDIRQYFSEHIAGFVRDTATSRIDDHFTESVLPPPFVPISAVEVADNDERRLFSDDAEEVAGATADSDVAPDERDLTTNSFPVHGFPTSNDVARVLDVIPITARSVERGSGRWISPPRPPSPVPRDLPLLQVADVDKQLSLTSFDSDAGRTVVLATHWPATPVLTRVGDSDLLDIPIDDAEAVAHATTASDVAPDERSLTTNSSPTRIATSNAARSATSLLVDDAHFGSILAIIGNAQHGADAKFIIAEHARRGIQLQRQRGPARPSRRRPRHLVLQISYW